jgi:chromosome segregation ATPase
LQHADETDGAVTKSISFVINELRAEIARAKTEHLELRSRISALEAKNEEQRAEIAGLRAKAAATCAACGVDL